MTAPAQSVRTCRDFEGAEVTTHSAAETHALGQLFAKILSAGHVVALNGDLGSGKTCFIRGICAGLDSPDLVNSPTFILINHYGGRVDGGEIPIYHFDLYRLSGVEELDTLGAEEFLYGEGICLIEWAERASGHLPGSRWEVDLAYVGASQRSLRFRRREEADLPGTYRG